MIYKGLNKISLFIIGFLSLILVVLGLRLLMPKHGVTVILTKEGFTPNHLDINKGDTVFFTSKAGVPFWPASDLHPSHTLYPEFDPKRAIDPGKTWSFKFDKAGTWTYHNHLDPNTLGVIVVHDSENKKRTLKDPASCHRLSTDTEKLKCWSTALNDVLEYRGIEQAFGTLDGLLKSEPDFEPYCHSLVHEVGAKAYELFSEHKGFGLTTQTSLCGYGFYHGFTETLAAEGGGIDKAREFCSYVDAELGGKLPGILDQCYHGFGHGSVDIHNEQIWGNEIAMIQPALKMCRDVAIDSQKLFRCGTGMFDSISIGYFTNNYNLKMRASDPFWLCRQQKETELKQSCYVSFDPALLIMENMNFSKAVKSIENIKEDQYAIMAMGSLALPVTWVKNRLGAEASVKIGDFYKTKGLDACRNFQKRLVEPCVQSISYALAYDESPSKQYQEGLQFCQSPDLSADERGICMRTVINTVAQVFPKDQVKSICQELKPADEIYCSGKF